MNDFDFDVMEKKRIASSARHKVASVKGSRKCSLPCDNLTPAQIRKLSGAPVTYRLDRPMSWEEFKAMPDDLQAEYLRRLISAYGVNAKVLGGMFGKNNQTVINRQKKLGVPSAPKGARMNAQQEELWQTFLDGGAEDVAREDIATEPTCEEQVTAEAEVPVTETAERMELDCFTACVTGRYSPEAMLAILGTMPIPDGRCTIRIEVTRV